MQLTTTNAHDRPQPKAKAKNSPINLPDRIKTSLKDLASTLIESQTPIYRDPRFLHITGTYDPQKFKSQYTFLSTLHISELSTLRSNLSLAGKLFLYSLKDLRAARERGVGRLELAVKRVESSFSVNRDKREMVEMEVLEREKRGKGKAGGG
ncbi:hypothetical protein EDB19DRAFT_570861 [Suillus lakei]|nr:hypothetical protein EDB19DRAFT_570861 [Suillus lakei]